MTGAYLLFTILTIITIGFIAKNLAANLSLDLPKDILPSSTDKKKWKVFFNHSVAIDVSAWLLTVIAVICLFPVLCWQAITRYPGLILGSHAILLTCVLMWRKEGSNTGKWFLTIVLVVAFLIALGERKLLPRVPGFTTEQKRIIVEKKKTEIRGPYTEIEVTEDKWSDPIIRIDGWNWSLDYYAEKKARIKIERGNKVLGEWKFGGGLPPVTTISARPKDKIFFRSLEGTQKIFVQYIDRS